MTFDARHNFPTIVESDEPKRMDKYDEGDQKVLSWVVPLDDNGLNVFIGTASYRPLRTSMILH